MTSSNTINDQVQQPTANVQSSSGIPVPDLSSSKKRRRFQRVRLFENETEDNDEIQSLKRIHDQNESNESDQEPKQKARKGVKRCQGRPTSMEDIAGIPEGRKIVRIQQSSKKNRTTIGFVLDVNINDEEYKLNSQDVNSSGIINFRCSKRKSGCQGRVKLVVKDLRHIEEYSVNNRMRFKVTNPDLTTNDVYPTEITDHTCVQKSLAARYESLITEHAVKIAQYQKDHKLNNRQVFTSEVLDHILTGLSTEIPKEDLKQLKEAASSNKLNLRKIEDRITKALRNPNDQKVSAFNINNQADFKDYPAEFHTGVFDFDEDFAVANSNMIWLFYHKEKLELLNKSEGVMVQDNTWLFGKKPKEAEDLRAFRHVWKMRFLNGDKNDLIALACMRQQTAAAFTSIFDRLKLHNNNQCFKVGFLVQDREKGTGYFNSQYFKIAYLYPFPVRNLQRH